MSQKRTVFFVSDRTGITAETLGNSLLTQFEKVRFKLVTLPFISTIDKAQDAVSRIDEACRADRSAAIVFSTLISDEIRSIIKQSQGLFLDFFDAFIGPLERELGVKSSHTAGRAHGNADQPTYLARIDAVNFVLAHDDGVSVRSYDKADIILVGVSRSGKTPTCLYMGLQYGVFAANYPLIDEDLESRRLPECLLPYKNKLYGLTIEPTRLQQIRNGRRPDSRYASSKQVKFEVREAEELFDRQGIPFFNTTHSSIEEIATTILHETGIKRRFH